MNKQEALGAYKVLNNILKLWSRDEFDGHDFISVERLESEKQRMFKIYKLLEETD